MKYKKIILTICCILLMPLFFLTIAHGDIGNSFSGGGGGYSGGGSYSGSGFGGFLFLGGSSPFGMIIMVLVVIFVVYSKYKTGTNMNASSYQGVNRMRVDNEPSAITKIQEIDPEFSADNFKAYVSEVFITLQEAWEAKQWQGVRPFESNALFNTHNRQIQEYIDMNKTDHLNMQNIRDVSIAEFKNDGNQEVLVIKLNASLLNYVSDDATGKVIEGSKTNYVHRTYCLEFIRSAGVKTNIDKQLAVTNCPNCGAPTKVSSSGECEYCHSIITNGNYGWVLNKYAAW